MYEFSTIINHDNLERNMKLFFDEHIAMYNIICKFNIGIDISTCADETSITYKVVPFDSNDMDKLLDILSQATVSIYGHRYTINITKGIEDNILNITLKDKNTSD